MLQLSYVGIAFSLVYYIVFGVAVRLMELSNKARNKARLFIIVSSMGVFSISGLIAGIFNLRIGVYYYGIFFIVLSVVSVIIAFSIVFELHQINARVRMRRFMVLFDIVDRFITEGRTKEEIMDYLTGKQKLTVKEASDFMEFISDPNNHQFLADVNDQIQEAKSFKKSE